MPVSYTHLFYIHNICFRNIKRHHCICKIYKLFRRIADIKFIFATCALFPVIFHIFTPVSYTHLDVYKRQALVSMGMNYFITAQGFPFLGMATTLIGAVVNIVLDPIFIFVFEMDIAGAAVATVIAQLSSCIFVLLTLHSKKMQIPIHLVKPEWEIGKRICKIGFSPFLILATDSVIIIALNAVLQYYGGESQGDTLITAATIVQSYMLLITSPMLGITGGSQPLISFNYGANKPDRIRKTVK